MLRWRVNRDGGRSMLVEVNRSRLSIFHRPQDKSVTIAFFENGFKQLELYTNGSERSFTVLTAGQSVHQPGP